MVNFTQLILLVWKIIIVIVKKYVMNITCHTAAHIYF